MPIYGSTSSTNKSSTPQKNPSTDSTTQAKSGFSSSSSATSKDTGAGWDYSYFMNLSKLKKLSFDCVVVANLESATACKDSNFFF